MLMPTVGSPERFQEALLGRLPTNCNDLTEAQSDSYTPTITLEHWQNAKAIAEQWRVSAARLLKELDESAEAVQEQLDLYRNLTCQPNAPNR